MDLILRQRWVSAGCPPERFLSKETTSFTEETLSVVCALEALPSIKDEWQWPPSPSLWLKHKSAPSLLGPRGRLHTAAGCGPAGAGSAGLERPRQLDLPLEEGAAGS